MVGQVLDYEAKRILNEGIDRGRAEGLMEGRVEGRIEGLAEGRTEGVFDTLISLVSKGLLSLKDAAAQAGITEADFQQKIAGK